MSFSVLVIPEDPQQNGHILKPLVQAIMRDVGRQRAGVKLLTQPRVRGYDQAVKAIRDELPAKYGFMDLWLFFPDVDKANKDAMRNLETHAAAKGITLLCCAAQPEVEIYGSVGYRDDIREAWEKVRQHPRMKEEVFDPLLARHGDPRRPGAGRDSMIDRSLRNLPLLFRLCPELRCLRDRIATHLQNLHGRADHSGT